MPSTLKLLSIWLVAFTVALTTVTWAGPISRSFNNPRANQAAQSTVKPGFPNFQSEDEFSLNGLRLLITPKELKELLGDPQREIDEGFSMYSENASVRIRDGRVVNIAVGKPSQWTLSQKGQEFLSLGDPRTKVLDKFGSPYAVYVHPEKPISIMLYPSLKADIGIFIHNDQVDGFMLTEPGYLGQSMQYGGYVIEANPQ